MEIKEILNILLYSLEATFICCIITGIYCANTHVTKRIQPEDLFGMLSLICLAGFRYEVGSDYIRYLQSYSFASDRFSDLSTLFNKETLARYSYEIGYEALSVLVSRITRNKYAIFWAIALILYIPLIVYFRKKTCDANVAFATFILFGFWGLSLNIMKQAIAMMLLLWIYESLKNRKYVIVGLLSIISLGFHTSSIAAILALIVIHILQSRVYIPTKRNLKILIAVGIALRFGISLVLALLTRISILSKYTLYLDSEFTRIDRSFIWIGALIETVIVVILLNAAIKNIANLKRRVPDIEKVISIIMIGVPLSIIGISRQLWLANRFAKYFFLFLVVLVPSMLGKDRENGRRRYLYSQNTRIIFWFSMIVWHMMYAVLMLDNNFYSISSYLFL